MIELRTIDTHQVPVQVFEGGAGEDIVVLHDAGGFTAEHPFLLALAANYRVHAPLLPGYGDFGGSAGHPRHARYHAAYLRRGRGAGLLRRPLLIGCSLAATIAAEMAAIARTTSNAWC